MEADGDADAVEEQRAKQRATEQTSSLGDNFFIHWGAGDMY